MRNGFALIEILIVLVVFVLLTALANQVFFSVLRGSQKSEALTLVKQSGNQAISVIQRSLYNARGIVSCVQDKVTYRDADGQQTSFACSGVGGEDGYIASGSARLTGQELNATSCSISCNTTVNPAQVTVSFTLKKKTGERPEERVTLPFQTQVVLRN